MIDLDELERLYKEGAAQGDFLDWYKAIKPVAPQLIAMARRYQWLREHTVATGLSQWVHPHQFLDAAVDAAMQEQEQEP